MNVHVRVYSSYVIANSGIFIVNVTVKHTNETLKHYGVSSMICFVLTTHLELVNV